MSKIVFTPNASGTGNFTITSPNSNTNRQVDLPDAAGGIVIDSATQTLTNKTLTSPTISGTPVMSASVITSGTANTSLSGSAIDFTGIPSWVKRVTVMFNGVSTNGTSNKLIQVGAGSVTATGYVGATGYCTTAAGPTSVTTGFGLQNGGNAAELNSGLIILALVSGNNWVCSGTISTTGSSQPGLIYTNGQISLGGALDRVRITTVNGTDTFDAGSINILYE